VWQRAAVLALLAIILVALNSLYFALAGSRSALSAPPGDVLYAAGFDAFTDEWQQYQGRLSSTVEKGVLTLSVDDVQSTIYSLASPTFADFDLTVQATPQNGPIDNSFGVVFRLQQARQNACDMPLVVLCDLSHIGALGVPLRLLFRPASAAAEGYYMFLISADGYYSVWKAQQTSAGPQARRVSAWIATDLIEQGLGATNTLRVVARGVGFQFFINGRAVPLCLPDDPNAESTYSGGVCYGTMRDTWQDDSFAQGQIGVVAQTTPTGGLGVVVSFDNVVIISPRSPAEAGT
jgi:hypothetical protein